MQAEPVSCACITSFRNWSYGDYGGCHPTFPCFEFSISYLFDLCCFVIQPAAQVSLEAKAGGIQLEPQDKQGLLQTASGVWYAEASGKRNKQRSYYAKDIVDTVIGLGLQYVEEDTASGYAVDVSLPTLKVAIEADGPSHRSRNTSHLLGSTVMKQRHVHHAGWQLLTVPHDDWDELRGRQQKLAFLQTRIDQLK